MDKSGEPVARIGVFLASVLLVLLSTSARAARDDVLIVVNDNSFDSPLVGAYYAEQRDIDPANIVHVRVPNSYFIRWEDFRRLRDQLIRSMQEKTLDDAALAPVVCTDGDSPYYCPAAMDQLRAHTRIRYVVTTRGIPTRMVVDGSTLFSPAAPTSVDNYLKYWLINYFAEDVQLRFTEREVAFGDGRNMRTVNPAQDRELIVGRIDGLNLAAARSLVDRALAVEGRGLYGRLYGSTYFRYWVDHNMGQLIYPPTGLKGWPYQLGLFDESRPECIGYLDFAGNLPEGKTPAHCRVQLNEDSNPVAGSRYPAPGNAGARQPQAVDALLYQGWLDGQASVGSFNALLNWRKDDQCTVTLCEEAPDPTACRAASTDVFQEINTDCVGVAEGFMGYNHQSFPLSYLAAWPTGWFQTTSNASWIGSGDGDVNQLAFPEIRTDIGFDDSHSLWFGNTDQVDNPACFPASDFSGPPSVPCRDERRVILTQRIPLAAQALDVNNPQTYRIGFRYKADEITKSTSLRVRFFVHETGAGNTQLDYGLTELASLAPGDTDWTLVEAQFQLDPALHTGPTYDGIKLRIETAGAYAGALGIDAVSVQALGTDVELVTNGTFTEGHRQVAAGDHAANFLNRLGGVAFWGSVSHHQSAGCAFCLSVLEPLVYFLRGLPLGDAVWFNESNNSGILYGDPLYSPVAVRLDPVNATDTVSDGVELYGSTVNGRNASQVSTTYAVDVCPGNDFFVCDQNPGAWQSTGIGGSGGAENMLLGRWDISTLASGAYTLRLAVTSQNTATGRSQTLNDFYPVTVQNVLSSPRIVSSILPASRAVQTGSTAAAFATLSNAGTTALTGCWIFPSTLVPARFTFQTTDPLTNALTGAPNVAVGLEAGASQSFLIAFTPTQAFVPTDIHFDFSCAGGAAADVIPGVNTFLLSASATPGPDMIALAASNPPGQVILDSAGAGAFAVATANVGSAGTVTVSADANGPVETSVCETDPPTGACINPSLPTAGSVTTTAEPGATPTFAVFVHSATGAPIPFDPAVNRVFFRIRNQAGDTIGSTSVAYSQPQ